MKTLIVILLCSGVAWADQASDAFGTGFANALRRQIEMRQAQEANYRAYEADQAREQELELLKEQIQLQRETLELERRKHRESLYKKQ